MSEPLINIKDMKPGDIILFKAEDDWISKAIALLTRSDVTHAALYMGEGILADEEFIGLACHRISQPASNTRGIYVRRLKNVNDIAPVLDASKRYIDKKEPYDMSALVLLALILLYRDVPAHLIPKPILNRILKEAARSLDVLINQHRYPGQKPMVCSQFVFQCYEDAGGIYKLDLHNGTFTECPRINSPARNMFQKVAAKLRKNHHSLSSSIKRKFREELPDLSSSLEELVALLDRKDEQPLSRKRRTLAIDAGLAQAVKLFSNKWYVLRQGLQRKSSRKKLLYNAVSYSPALFVTPSDLKSCITNLETVGIANIYRDDAVVQYPI
jgi:hypothetical protein